MVGKELEEEKIVVREENNQPIQETNRRQNLLRNEKYSTLHTIFFPLHVQ